MKFANQISVREFDRTSGQLKDEQDKVVIRKTSSSSSSSSSSSESDSEELSELESFFFTGNALTGDLATGVSSSELESSRIFNKILY